MRLDPPCKPAPSVCNGVIGQQVAQNLLVGVASIHVDQSCFRVVHAGVAHSADGFHPILLWC